MIGYCLMLELWFVVMIFSFGCWVIVLVLLRVLYYIGYERVS